MRVRLRPRLVNRKDQDPALLVEREGVGDFVLFDCGSIDRIPKSDLLRISHVFVTHTHIDHFVGFDRLLRNTLGSASTISVWGPGGITANVRGKLAAYTWNLIEDGGPTFVVHEIDGDAITTTRLRLRRGFEVDGEPLTKPVADGVLLVEHQVRVRYATLEHQIPSLGFSIQEEPFASVRADRVRASGLREGPWLKELTARAHSPAGPDDTLDVFGSHLALSRLLAEFVEVRRGRKVTYVTDTVFSERTLASVVWLAGSADDFYCEANYQEADADKAQAYFHLTARQAATFARKARVRRLILFHVSKKYNGDIKTSMTEAATVFEHVE